jgi:hemerythrin-like domain-containing protein
MQRSQSLIPFSHDHHHGLVVCRRIQEGLNRNIDPGRITDYVRDFWLKDLEQHFEEEENLLLPLLEEPNVFVKRTRDEHKRIRLLIEQMSEGDEEAQESILAAFAELLNAHIRFEERELFPLIESEAGTEKLEKVAIALAGKQAPPHIWSDAFWKQRY